MLSQCNIPKCPGLHYGRGWCKRHYQRWRYSGNPLGVHGSLQERFEAKFQRGLAAECWAWQGYRFKGYGRFNAKGTNVLASRFSYELYVAPIPLGFQIDHLCSNPPCVNPNHLEAVTPRINTLRGQAFSAINARKTHCIHGHAFDERNTGLTSERYRYCRRCKREAMRLRRLREELARKRMEL